MDIRAKNKKVWARSKPFFSRNERRKWERRSSWKTGWHVLLLDVRPCQTTYRRSKFTFKYVGHMFDSTMHPHWFMVLGTFQLSSRLFFFFVFFFFYFHSYYGMVLNSSSGASPKSVTSLFLWFHGAGISRAHRTVPDITVWMDWNSARRSIHVIWQKAKEKEKPTCVCVCVISSLSFPFVRGKVFFFLFFSKLRKKRKRLSTNKRVMKIARPIERARSMISPAPTVNFVLPDPWSSFGTTFATSPALLHLTIK